MMTCRTCGAEKPLDQMNNFWHNIKQRRQYGPDCKECRSAKRRADVAAKVRDAAKKRERYAADPEYRKRVRAANVKHRYDLAAVAFDALLAAQGGVCAICGAASGGSRGWHVDHDHSCCGPSRACVACVRGILCGTCNVGIGHFRDDPDLLTKARAYLLGKLAERSTPA